MAHSYLSTTATSYFLQAAYSGLSTKAVVHQPLPAAAIYNLSAAVTHPPAAIVHTLSAAATDPFLAAIIHTLSAAVTHPFPAAFIGEVGQAGILPCF